MKEEGVISLSPVFTWNDWPQLGDYSSWAVGSEVNLLLSKCQWKPFFSLWIDEVSKPLLGSMELFLFPVALPLRSLGQRIFHAVDFQWYQYANIVQRDIKHFLLWGEENIGLSSKDLNCNPLYMPQWILNVKTEKQPAVTKRIQREQLAS